MNLASLKRDVILVRVKRHLKRYRYGDLPSHNLKKKKIYTTQKL